MPRHHVLEHPAVALPRIQLAEVEVQQLPARIADKLLHRLIAVDDPLTPIGHIHGVAGAHEELPVAALISRLTRTPAWPEEPQGQAHQGQDGQSQKGEVESLHPGRDGGTGGHAQAQKVHAQSAPADHEPDSQRDSRSPVHRFLLAEAIGKQVPTGASAGGG